MGTADQPKEFPELCPSVGFAGRLEHFTWAWFTTTMSTGGIALLLSSQPHSFSGLLTIGKVVYVIDIVMFIFICCALVFRFTKYPKTLKSSLSHPTESLFYATFWISLASIITCMAKYGVPSSGPWLVYAYRIIFWTYFACTFISAVFQYFFLFTSPQLTIQDATPAWDLPIFPFMLAGTIAAAGTSQQPRHDAMSMLVGGLTAQGLGMMVSVLMFTIYIRRMIQFGLPSPNTRPAMFISVGPPSFTSLAIITLAKDYPANADYFGDYKTTQQVVLILATFTSVFIWSLAAWFFCISLVSCLAVYRKMTFHLNWWAFVFPNVGFTIATIDIGQTLQSQGITWVGSGMTLMLVMIYLFVLCRHVVAVWKKEILWPGKDEDVHKPEEKGKLGDTPEAQQMLGEENTE